MKTPTKSTGNVKRLVGLNLVRQAAAENLIRATEEEFPVGCTVAATLANADIVGTVTGVGDCWWYEPWMLTLMNAKTGKLWKVNPLSMDHNVRRLD